MAGSFTVGSLECALIEDGSGGLPAEVLFGNAAPAERETALGARLEADGRVLAPYHCLLVRSGGRVVLVDAGLGLHEHPFGGSGGRLEDELGAAGVQPGDVDVVVVTHGHPDHIGGLCRDGAPLFGRARHLVSRAEWDAWEADGRLDDPETVAHGQIPPLEEAGVLERVAGTEEVAPGVRLLPAPGHTPGQLAVQLGEDALYLADVVVDELHVEHPDWAMAWEPDAALVLETRQRLLGRAADEELVVAAAHLAGPARVERAGDAFRLVRAAR